jgi:hypothetical protein
MRKDGKTHGNKTPPQITMHKIKNEKEKKKQLLSIDESLIFPHISTLSSCNEQYPNKFWIKI